MPDLSPTAIEEPDKRSPIRPPQHLHLLAPRPDFRRLA